MSRLAGDPHPRTARKPSTGFTSAAARLLLRHSGGREAAIGESIEFFSALRKCLPDPQISGQNAAGAVADGKGKARRGGGGGSADEVLSLSSSGIGKHDYDWLLTPPGTPLWSPATSTSGSHQVSSAMPSRLAKAGSASYGKSNSRVSLTGHGEKETPKASRLSNGSSATSVNNAVPASGRPLRVRTSSASSINTASNASVSSAPLWSGGSSPRTPGTAARSSVAATAINLTRRRDKPRLATSYVVVQSMAAASKSKPGAPSPTCTRARQAPGVSSPRSTASTSSRQTSLTRRADVAVARSSLASQSVGTGSTLPQPRDAHRTRRSGASGVASSSSGVRSSRQTAAAVKQGGVAAATPASQRWRQSLAPATAAARNVRRGNALDNGSPVYNAGQKINDEKARPHRTAATAASMGSGLTKTGSWKSASTGIVKRAVNENEDCRRRQDGRHGGADGAPDQRKPALLQGTRRSVTSRSRLGLMAAATSKSGSIASSHQHAAPVAAVAKVARADAFPSTRYDAMLLREDPKNLTWLRGCDEEDDGGSAGGIDLVDSSLELFDMPTRLSRTVVRI